MTVEELIELLEGCDPEAQVFIGNDRKDYGWYTYGGVTRYDVEEEEEEEEEHVE